MKTRNGVRMAVTVLATAFAGLLMAADLTPTLKAKLTDTLVLDQAKGKSQQVTADVIGANIEGQIVGAVTVEPAGNAKRVKVAWNSLTTKERGTTTTVPLSTPLKSQFLVKTGSVSPGTTVTMQGSASVVTDAAKKLALKMEQTGLAKAKAGIAAGTDAASSIRRSADAGGGVGTTTPTNSLAANAKGPTADVLTPKIVACPDRIDKTAGHVFKQQKTDSVDSTGAVIKSTECSDIQPGYAIQKAYGGACTTLVDTTNLVAYKGYREFATVDGKEVEVTPCTNETTVPYALTATSATCSVRNDLTNGVAIQQKKYYYTDNGTQVDATTCADSTEQYAIYQTTTTCSPIYDQANGLAFTQKRSAYDGPGGTVYVTDCAPVSTTGVAVSEENCASPKYEHDFTTGVSYVLTRKYYMDGASKVYLSSCARSASVSYNHKHTTTNCGVTNDDAQLRTTFNQNTYIETPDDGTVEIKPCESGNVVAYVTLSNGWVPTSVRATSLYYTRAAGTCGLGEGNDPLWYEAAWQYESGGCTDGYVKTEPGLTFINVTLPGGYAIYRYVSCTRGNYEKRITYQRGDGSQFTKIEKTATDVVGPESSCQPG
jgi:hypothetical protein